MRCGFLAAAQLVGDRNKLQKGYNVILVIIGMGYRSGFHVLLRVLRNAAIVGDEADGRRELAAVS